MKKLRFSLFHFLILGLLMSAVTACSSDDDEDDSSDDDNTTNACAVNFTSGAATGKFAGDDFTVVDGYATEDPFDSSEIRVTLFGRMSPGDKCDGWNFDKPDSSIIFTVPNAVGTYTLGFGEGKYTVTFNEIVSGQNQTNAVVAACGAVEITSITGSQVTGNIQADGQDDGKAILNGTFSVVYCPDY